MVKSVKPCVDNWSRCFFLIVDQSITIITRSANACTTNIVVTRACVWTFTIIGGSRCGSFIIFFMCKLKVFFTLVFTGKNIATFPSGAVFACIKILP